MDSVFIKEFETILDDMLTDYRGQMKSGVDTSEGSLIFIKSACMASAMWGLYRHQEWISDQIFADTADVANMEHHAATQGLSRRVGETDQELLARYLDALRRPAAGGNKYDYVKWSLEVDGVKTAYSIPMGQGAGSVDVVIVANNATGIPDQVLIDKVKAHIDDVRPCGMRYLRVLAPTECITDVTLSYSGAAEETAVQADVTAYLNTIPVGSPLVLMQLAAAIMKNNGVDDLNVAAPEGNVVVSEYQKIKPGVIHVTKL